MTGAQLVSVTHFEVRDGEVDFAQRAQAALAALAARPGYLGGGVGRSTDDERCWVLMSHWADVGSYRRALGAYDVKLTTAPLLSAALDLPSSFEQLISIDVDQQVLLRGSDRA